MIILTISHDLNITAKYAHQVIMLAKPGIVYAVGPPAEILTQENITAVYGIKCRVIDDDEYVSNPYIEDRNQNLKIPHIILGEAMEVDDDS